MRGLSRLLLFWLLLAPGVAAAMPQAMIYVGALMAGYGTSAAVIAWGVTLIVVGTAWGQAEQRRAMREQEAAARASYNAALKDRTATIISADHPHVYVYGRDVVVGARVVDVLTSGDRDQYHHLVCVHADHECEAILDVAINDKWLGALDANGYVTTGDFIYTHPVDATEYKSGTVFTLAHPPVSQDSLRITYMGGRSNESEISMPFVLVGDQVTVSEAHDFTCSYQWTESIPRVRVIKRLGTAGTPADAVTMAECPEEYTSTCTLDGKCATLIRLDLDHAEFQSGMPTIKVKLNGKKVHDVRDPLYPADTPLCSSNNALCIADYLTSDMCRVPGDAVVLSGTAQAAAAESITLPAGAVETTDYYRDMRVRITSGAGSVQERKVLGSRTNLFVNSERPSTANITSSTITDNAAIGPFGTMNAASIIETAVSSQHQFYRNVDGMAAGQVVCISTYTKALGVGAQRYLLLALSGGAISVTAYANFSLDGTMTYRLSAAATDAGIEDVGNGWYRCWMRAVLDVGGTVSVTFKYSDVATAGYRVWLGDGVSGLLATGMQFETTELSTYIRTAATAAVGVSVDRWSSNLCGHSEQYNSWERDLVVVTDNAGLSPVGDMTAELVVPTAVYGQHRIKYAVTLTASVTYTWSQRLKRSDAANGLHCYMLIWNGSEQKTGTFNLDDVVASGSSPYKGITDLGDGWFECWMTITPTATAAFTMMSYLTNSSFTSSITGDGVSGLYHWGSQLEVGIGPSAYIKTVGTALVALPDATSVLQVQTDNLELPMDDYIAAANACDELIDIGGEMLPRYTLNGTVRSDQDRGQVLEQMALSMAGVICATTWSVRAGVWEAPVMALTQDDIVGDFSFTAGSSDADLYNGIKGQYISADNLYVATDYKPYQNAAYVLADGRELWSNLDFPFTDSLQRVHNIARILTEDQRNAFTCEGTFAMKAWQLELGCRVTFTSGFLGQSSKIYRVMRHEVGMQGVKLKLKEDAESILDTADAVTPDSTPNTNLPNPFAIAPLESITLASGTAHLQVNSDGTITSRIFASWPLPTTPAVVHGGYVEVEYRTLGVGAWNKVQVTGDDTGVYLAPVKDGIHYQVRARTVNPVLNLKSIWFYDNHQVVGKTELPTAVAVITATPTLLNVVLEWEEIDDPDRKDYLIADDTGGALVWNVYAGAQAKLPPASAGLHTYRIISRDTSKLTALTEATCELTIEAPSAPLLSSAIKDGMVDLTWNDCTATHQLRNYEVRYGADWASGTFVGRADTQSLRITPNWTGDRTFFVRGTDIAGNDGAVGSVVVPIGVAVAPVLTGAFEADSLQLSWTEPAGTLPVDQYELRVGSSWAGATSLGAFKVTAHRIKADWVGDRIFWVAAIDGAGNPGTPAAITVTVTAAAAPVIITEVIDNNVLLRWDTVAGTLPITGFELRKGSTWAAGEPIGQKSGSFTLVFETLAGIYTYWLAAIDSAGNYGTPGSISATVSQPPDYVLKADYDSLLNGTKSNMALHGDADNSLIGPVNTTETFAAHFTARGWTTPQAQIDAGYPVYAQPNLSPAYYEEVIDYGVVLDSNRITITATTEDLVGTVAQSCKISVSADGSSYTDYDGVWQVYASAFRYVKYRITFTASASTDLIELKGVNIRLDSKLKTATKMVSCAASDSGGTTVYLTDDWSSTGNKLFLDVDAIALTPKGTTPVTAMYDFTDAPNPLSLKILLFDNAGTRVTGTCSMTVRGF